MRQPYERRGLSEKQSSKNYRKRQEKMARAKSKARRGRSLTTTKQEHKYQMIKLMHSGRSLRETKAMMKLRLKRGNGYLNSAGNYRSLF